MDSHAHPRGEAAGFEAALEILDRLIGFAAGKIDEEQVKPSPAPGHVTHWVKQRDAWAATRRSLEPGDLDGVRTVLERDGATLQSFLGGSDR